LVDIDVFVSMCPPLKRAARRESSATNKTILLTVGDSSVEQKNAP
jgi:hypothetical protein